MLMRIQRVLAQGIRGLYARWSSSGKLVRPICIVLLSLLLEGCTRPSAHEPVTLTFVEEWTTKTFSEGRQQELQGLGGAGLAVSRRSTHPHEALELVRYLSSSDVQAKRSRVLSEPPTLSKLYGLPEVLGPNPHFALLSQAFQTGMVSRPSNVTGKKYQDVSDSYIQAVHSVLTGEKSAPEAAAAVEKELVRITGFKRGPPRERSAHP
jgi:hypothetical protein